MKQIEQKQIKAIWAAARQHSIDRQGVYDIILAIAGKEHMRELTPLEADKVKARVSGYEVPGGQRRTDEGGNPKTVHLRRRIYILTGQLGWNDSEARINGMCKKMFGAEKLLWLPPRQCHQLIEALKKMVEREGRNDG